MVYFLLINTFPLNSISFDSKIGLFKTFINSFLGLLFLSYILISLNSSSVKVPQLFILVTSNLSNPNLIASLTVSINSL